MCRSGRAFVLAVPDGRAGGRDTEWCDDEGGQFGVETFVTTTAVALVEGGQRRVPALRAIGGFSMGGYGAAALALRHPDEYRQVAAFGGYFRIDDRDGVFGRQGAAHDPGQLLASAAGQRYLLIEGRDERTPLKNGTIRGEAERFAAQLRLHQAAVSVLHPPGGHDNEAWYPALDALVDFLDAGWAGN
jgi:S-formylglutathione hydrolase FrmB